jgi:hypothetical protein
MTSERPFAELSESGVIGHELKEPKLNLVYLGIIYAIKIRRRVQMKADRAWR